MRVAIAACMMMVTAAHAADLPRPSMRQIAVIEQQIGKGIAMPPGSGALKDHDRHYWIENGDGLVLAQFVSSASPRKHRGVVHSTSRSEYRPVTDGGCAILNLVYYGEGDARNHIRCGGR